jgi:hypothetical protein
VYGDEVIEHAGVVDPGDERQAAALWSVDGHGRRRIAASRQGGTTHALIPRLSPSRCASTTALPSSLQLPEQKVSLCSQFELAYV